MSKRITYKSIYIAGEGHRERALLRFFFEYLLVADLEKCKIRITIEEDMFGGNNGKVIKLAIKHYEYDKRIAFTDNDVQIELNDKREIYKELQKCWKIDEIPIETNFDELMHFHNYDSNPVVIISKPINVETVVIRFLGKGELLKKWDLVSSSGLSKTKKELKSALGGIFGIKSGEDNEFNFYVKNIDRELCIQRINTIPQLKLLFQAVFGNKYYSKNFKRK